MGTLLHQKESGMDEVVSCIEIRYRSILIWGYLTISELMSDIAPSASDARSSHSLGVILLVEIKNTGTGNSREVQWSGLYTLNAKVQDPTSRTCGLRKRVQCTEHPWRMQRTSVFYLPGAAPISWDRRHTWMRLFPPAPTSMCQPSQELPFKCQFKNDKIFNKKPSP